MARAKKVSKSGKKAASKSVAAKKSTKKKAVTKKTPASRSKTSATKKSATTTKSTKKAPAKKAATKATDKKTPAAKPRAKKAKSPFESRFLEQMRKLLHTERDTYDRQATMLQAEADSLVADIDPGDVQFDEESGEGDTIAVERGRDLALASKAREMIQEIDHALSKFDLGTYGICEVSEEPIPKERLEAIPWAREKVEYKVGGFGRR
ncbi:TraR/DksA family transcriptional regulator [Actinospongicola halichondriae]|uniref:TraR/DksA family transcriptional regulator n=1 Tax=Actinospongicola halichondriae TaxID=3236844 RepID=UPI003D3E6C42